MIHGRMHRAFAFAALLAALALLAACGGGTGSGAEDSEAETLRLGYFPNVTHATAIAGVREGIFEEKLGPDVELDTRTFNAGPEAIEAIFSGGLDATYIGPNPAINAFARSQGQAIRIVAGATSGGAFLVVKPDIDGPDDLRGKTLSSPQLGNTQDVALRAWLKDEGIETDTAGGGGVEVKPQPNAQIVETFGSGSIDGAWVPEPFATRLVTEGKGKILVDERDLWPDGRYVTTHLIVRTEYLEDNPDVIEKLLEGHLAADRFVHENAEAAKTAVNEALEELSGKGIAKDVLDAAWKNLQFTVDPIASSLERSAEDAIALELLEPVDLDGIYDLDILNELLRAAGQDEVDGL